MAFDLWVGARWCGLRCSSEILRLKWQDIDFASDRFIVHASKTAHHADGGVRTVPMFPELKPLFQSAFDIAKDGDVYCINRYRDNSTNLRTQMYKIIARAGFKPRPKVFQNLRSTRETELFKMTNGNVKEESTSKLASGFQGEVLDQKKFEGRTKRGCSSCTSLVSCSDAWLVRWMSPATYLCPDCNTLPDNVSSIRQENTL